MKNDELNKTLIERQKAIKRYFDRDLPEVQFQTIRLLKNAIKPVIDEIRKDRYKKLELHDPDFCDLLTERAHKIMDQISKSVQIKAEEEFEAPIVLSFLSNTVMPNCFQPSEYYSNYEFSRLEFTSSGALHPDFSIEQSDMLIGGFVIVRSLVHQLLLNNSAHYPDTLNDISFDKYLRAIGVIIYYGYIEHYTALLPPIPNNTSIITQGAAPYPLISPLSYSNFY